MCELGLRVGKRCFAAREPRRVVGEELHEPPQSVAVDAVAQVERDEGRLRLRRSRDAGLMSPVEWHDAGTRIRCPDLRSPDFRRFLPPREAKRLVCADGRGRAEPGDSSPEEELPPSRAGATRSLVARHQLLSACSEWSISEWSISMSPPMSPMSPSS